MYSRGNLFKRNDLFFFVQKICFINKIGWRYDDAVAGGFFFSFHYELLHKLFYKRDQDGLLFKITNSVAHVFTVTTNDNSIPFLLFHHHLHELLESSGSRLHASASDRHHNVTFVDNHFRSVRIRLIEVPCVGNIHLGG